jgi:hypothetical protein
MPEDFGTIVLNDLTAHGLRRVHIMRSGKRAEPSQWTHLIPVEAEDSYEHFCIRDSVIKDTWHLWLIWHVHEVITLNWEQHVAPLQNQKGILWYIEKSQTMRDEIENAVLKYLVNFEKWPEKILTAKLPKDAPGCLTWKDNDGTHVVKIEQMEGIPFRCVFVTGAEHGE